MKNIHILPTDKPSRLFLKENTLLLNNRYTLQRVFPKGKCQHIYITSDEEIKEGDWYISILENEVYKATKETQNIMSVANLIETTTYKNTHFKIILTTDPDLIKDGVQAIDDVFLEWFVENSSCESVEVNIMNKGYNKIKDIPYQECYQIIIPKEEPKQEDENYLDSFGVTKSEFETFREFNKKVKPNG
jgi:hypothetical protein